VSPVEVAGPADDEQPATVAAQSSSATTGVTSRASAREERGRSAAVIGRGAAPRWDEGDVRVTIRPSGLSDLLTRSF